MALTGDAGRRSWLWVIGLAVFPDAVMLLTPHTFFFGIAPGLYARGAGHRWPVRPGPS